ncbi:MAG: hypothetical protein K8S55_16220 [Phycisphaerae bacterium]|nr:hypothetical protein [Phycisphaerae bacterium]
MSRILEWLLNLKPGELAGGDWTVGFVSDFDNYIKLGLFVVMAAMIALTVHCYRREGQTPRRTKGILAGIRILVILLVVTILFQPAIIITATETLYSSVLLLIDDSMSMSYRDNYNHGKSDDVRKRLAKKLAVTEAELADMTRSEILVRQLGGKDSVLGRLNEHHPIEILKFSTDRPGRESYTNLLGAMPLGSGKVKAPAESADKSPAAPAVTAKKQPDPSAVSSLLDRLTAAGYATNHSAALRGTLERFQGRRIGAVVLISDGQPTNEDAAERLAAAMEYAGPVPRYAVMYGDPTPPKNLTIAALRMPRQVRANSNTTAEVVLANRNLKGDSADVCIYRRKAGESWPKNLQSTKPLAHKVVKLLADKPGAASVAGQSRGSQSVKIEFKPPAGQLGEYVYRALVKKRADELTGEDNFADAFVKVSDNKIRILLISGDAGWEFRYIRNYFLRQPDLYRLSIWQQNADEEVNQSSSTGMKLTRLPRTLKEMIDTGETKTPAAAPSALKKDKKADAGKDGKEKKPGKKTKPPVETIPPGYDVVILYDPTPKSGGFDKTFIKNLYDYVTIHRGGLCYITSNKNTAEILKDPAAKPLADLLPVTLTENPIDVSRIIHETRPKAWPIRLTGYGVDHPITRLEGQGQANRNLWDALPGIYWSHAVAWKKPAARVLAEHSSPDRKTRGRSQPEPLIAVHTVGSGRVLYMGFDETWRWRFIESGFYHRRFWGNVVRYLAPLNARQVVIATGGDRFGAGDKITVEVEAFDSEFKPLTDPIFPLKMIDAKTGQVREHTLKAIKGKPGRYKATIIAAATGTYILTCDEKIANRDRVAARQIVIELPRAEACRTEADSRTMQTFASRKDYFLRADQIDQLAELIPSEPLHRKEKFLHPLWDTPLAWLLIVILLTVEWIVRKRNNMT